MDYLHTFGTNLIMTDFSSISHARKNALVVVPRVEIPTFQTHIPPRTLRFGSFLDRLPSAEAAHRFSPLGMSNENRVTGVP
jgi:hypothetical protein